VTAIGYHSSDDGVLPLTPLGHQGNEGACRGSRTRSSAAAAAASSTTS
jgi:hypothetical protein